MKSLFSTPPPKLFHLRSVSPDKVVQLQAVQSCPSLPRNGARILALHPTISSEEHHHFLPSSILKHLSLISFLFSIDTCADSFAVTNLHVWGLASVQGGWHKDANLPASFSDLKVLYSTFGTSSGQWKVLVPASRHFRISP